MSGEEEGWRGLNEKKIVGWMKEAWQRGRSIYERKKGLVDVTRGRI